MVLVTLPIKSVSSRFSKKKVSPTHQEEKKKDRMTKEGRHLTYTVLQSNSKILGVTLTDFKHYFYISVWYFKEKGVS